MERSREILAFGEGRAVDQKVEAAVLGRDRGIHRVHLIVVRHITRQNERIRAFR